MLHRIAEDAAIALQGPQRDAGLKLDPTAEVQGPFI
jgi:hypothetical protein